MAPKVEAPRFLVEVPRSRQGRVQERPLSGQGVQISGRGAELVARAGAEVGDGFGRALDPIQQMLAEAVKQNDRAVGLEVGNSAATLRRSILEKAQQRRGKNAKGVSDDFLAEFDREWEQIEADVSSIPQREHARGLYYRHRGELEQSLNVYENKEFDRYLSNEESTGIANAQRDGHFAAQEGEPGWEGVVQRNQDEQSKIILDRAEREGWGNEATLKGIRDIRGDYYEKIIEGMLSAGKLDEVQNMLDDLPDGHLSPESSAKIHGVLERANRSAKIDAAIEDNQEWGFDSVSESVAKARADHEGSPYLKEIVLGIKLRHKEREDALRDHWRQGAIVATKFQSEHPYLPVHRYPEEIVRNISPEMYRSLFNAQRKSVAAPRIGGGNWEGYEKIRSAEVEELAGWDETRWREATVGMNTKEADYAAGQKRLAAEFATKKERKAEAVPRASEDALLDSAFAALGGNRGTPKQIRERRANFNSEYESRVLKAKQEGTFNADIMMQTISDMSKEEVSQQGLFSTQIRNKNTMTSAERARAGLPAAISGMSPGVAKNIQGEMARRDAIVSEFRKHGREPTIGQINAVADELRKQNPDGAKVLRMIKGGE